MKIEKHISDFKINWLKILHSKKISPLACRLQLTLLTCNAKTYKPKTDDIAKQFGVSPSTLDRAIMELKKTGYLKTAGYKEKTIWHVYDIQTFKDTTSGVHNTNQEHQNKNTTCGASLVYNDCGGKNTPPQSKSDEEEIEDFDISVGREITKEELKKHKEELPW